MVPEYNIFEIEENTTEADGTQTYLVEQTSATSHYIEISVEAHQYTFALQSLDHDNSLYLTADGEVLIQIDSSIQVMVIEAKMSVIYSNNGVRINGSGITLPEIKTFWFYDGLRFYSFKENKVMPITISGNLYHNKERAIYSIDPAFNKELGRLFTDFVFQLADNTIESVVDDSYDKGSFSSSGDYLTPTSSNIHLSTDKTTPHDGDLDGLDKSSWAVDNAVREISGTVIKTNVHKSGSLQEDTDSEIAKAANIETTLQMSFPLKPTQTSHPSQPLLRVISTSRTKAKKVTDDVPPSHNFGPPTLKIIPSTQPPSPTEEQPSSQSFEYDASMDKATPQVKPQASMPFLQKQHLPPFEYSMITPYYAYSGHPPQKMNRAQDFIQHKRSILGEQKMSPVTNPLNFGADFTGLPYVQLTIKPHIMKVSNLINTHYQLLEGIPSAQLVVDSNKGIILRNDAKEVIGLSQSSMYDIPSHLVLYYAQNSIAIADRAGNAVGVIPDMTQLTAAVNKELNTLRGSDSGLFESGRLYLNKHRALLVQNTATIFQIGSMILSTAKMKQFDTHDIVPLLFDKRVVCLRRRKVTPRQVLFYNDTTLYVMESNNIVSHYNNVKQLTVFQGKSVNHCTGSLALTLHGSGYLYVDYSSALYVSSKSIQNGIHRDLDSRVTPSIMCSYN